MSFTRSQVYSIVAEVDKYPEFVPWCVGTRKIERFLLDEDREFIESGTTAGQRAVDYIELSVGFRALHDSYVSRVLTDREVSVTVSPLLI
jgi:ribosome-associated toxin RatA of RatAB toxin-antitoxin module